MVREKEKGGVAMDKKEIIDIMVQRGFCFQSEAKNGGETGDLEFISDPKGSSAPPFSCTVHAASGQFQFRYAATDCISHLTTPPCGSFADGAQFRLICRKFEKAVKALHYGLN